jgi:Phage portal protein, SPP1 Gp6-like
MIFNQIIPPKGLTDKEVELLKANMTVLQHKHNRNVLRSNYYNIKKLLDKIGFSVPPEMRTLEAVLGWPAKAVDGLAGRIHLEGFVDAGKSGGTQDDLDEQFILNGMASEWPQVWVSTLIHGISFVAVTPGDVESGEPKVLIQSMPASEATGIWDVRRRQLSSALWCPQPVVEALGGFTQPQIAVLFTPESIVTLEREGNSAPWEVDRVKNPLENRLPVTPLRYKPQLSRPYGASRINKAVMYLTQLAMRTMLRTEVSAEFYSSPQRWAMGVDPEAFVDEDGNDISPWVTILGKIWTIGRDDDGDLPTVGQFPQATMQPHIEQLRSVASMFSAETALPLNSLGIVQDNPASAEAIEAAWSDMVQLAEGCQVDLGVPASHIAQNVMMTLNKGSKPDKYLKLTPKWRDASTPTKAAMADAITKLVGAGVLQPDSEVALEGLGYDATDIERIRAEHKKAKEDDPQAKLMTALNTQAMEPGAPPVPGQQPAAPAPAAPPNGAQPAKPPAKKAVANVGGNR